MARVINGYKPGLERRYVPESLGNSLDKDPVEIWILTPTEAQKRGFVKASKTMFALGPDGNPRKNAAGDPLIEIDLGDSLAWQKEAIVGFVSRVSNYTGAGGVSITDGQALWDHGESEIVNEVANEIAKSLSLTESQQKKSSASYASSPAVTPALSGIAASGGERVSIKYEDAENKKAEALGM